MNTLVHHQNTIVMLKNHFKIALRNLSKHKGYSIINILGLAVGLCCCLLIVSYIHDEINYDTFHPNHERTYRIALDRKFPDNQFMYARTPMPMGATLTREFPDVEASTRIFNDFGSLTFNLGDRYFDERNVLAVDSNFVDFFGVNFIMGDKYTALEEPNSIVLTSTTASKYFGDADPIGKEIQLENTGPLMVRGVVEAMPTNTHFHFDVLVSLSTFTGLYNNQFWGSYLCYTYVRLNEASTLDNLQANFPSFLQAQIEPQLQNFLGISYAEYVAAGNDHNYFFQPLREIHLKSNLQWELEPNGTITMVYLLGGISIFILLLACVNFMNLSTALSAGRSREVGMRKVLGAHRRELITQFLTESVIMCFAGLVVALLLTALVITGFNELTQKELSLMDFTGVGTIGAGVLFVIILGLLTGLYPSLFLSSFKPIAALRGKFLTGNQKSYLRNSLVVFQFSISIILVIGTLLIHHQLSYMNNRSLGFAKDQLVVIERSDLLGTNIEAWIQDVKSSPAIKEVSGTNTVPGRPFTGATFRDINGDASDRFLINNLSGDYDLIKTMGLEIVSGRSFDNNIASDSNAVVINEAAARIFKWSKPEGKELRPINGGSFKVIGVVKDFNFQSLHQDITPLAIFANDLSVLAPNLIVAKINTSKTADALKKMESSWNNLVPSRVFNYTFVDEEFGQLYESEQRSATMFTIFSLLAIFIACLGAFGLSAFMATQKTKEVGVRKVLGASVVQVLSILSKDFTILVVVANVIAWPIAYLGISWWLENFAFAVGVPWWVFPLAGIISLAISYVAVGYHTLVAAFKNPVETLRQE